MESERGSALPVLLWGTRSSPHCGSDAAACVSASFLTTGVLEWSLKREELDLCGESILSLYLNYFFFF